MTDQTNAITIKTSADELNGLAKMFVDSGYFQDSRSVSQAAVKILAGREMGFGPFASMTGVYVIQGRPALGANLLASAIKQSGRYDYRVVEMTETACEIEFYDRQSGKPVSIGKSRFTIDDARKAGTKNLDKFPRNMLFARAISNGHRWYCPDALGGAAVYVPEELGAEVTEDGDVVTGSFTPAPQPSNGTRPYTPAQVKEKLLWFVEAAEREGKVLAANVRKMLPVNLEKCFAGEMDSEARRKAVTAWLFGKESTKDLTEGEAYALNKWLDPKPDSGGDWQPDGMAMREAQAIYQEATGL